jgi:tetratricopeptide (TPR) repeat protein
MRHIGLHLFLVTLVSFPVWGQEDAQQEIQRAIQLGEQGQFAQVIELIKPFTSAATLSESDHGRAWLLLAMAYHQEGRYQEAITGYEQSLRIVGSDPKLASQYADAIRSFAILYRDTGDAETARKMLLKALSVYTEINDHAGIAGVCRSLANVALSQKRTGDARGYLERAFEASKDANGFNDDYFAALVSTEGWLNEVDKNYTAAESDYQQALTFWKHAHGEQHRLVGWGYMLCGKANAETGDITSALDSMQKGLGILEKAAGRANIMFIEGELAYAEVLSASGAHAEARQLKTTAEKALRDLYHGQCVQCRISAAALSLR